MENILSQKLSNKGVGRSPISDTEKLGDRFVRIAERNLGPLLKVSVSGMMLDNEVTRLAAVAEGIPVPALLGVLSFKGSESQALINMSSDLVFHIVDLLMGGDPEVCPMPTTRSFTAIDYGLLEGVLNAISKAFGQAISEMLGGELKSEFELVDIQQNITNISVAPDNADVLKFEISLDMGEAARGGDFDLVVPLSVLDIVRSSFEKKVNTDAEGVKDIWRESMQIAAIEADIPLTAVLHKAKLKASDIEGFTVGQVIPIPSNAPQSVALEIRHKGETQTEIASARLGVFEGKKVLKLTTSLNPRLQSYLQSVVQKK